MRRTSFAFAAFLLMLVLACATTVLNASRTFSATSQNSEIYGQLNLFGGVLDVVRSKYVEKPDDAMLIESAITGMLSALDPHSAYMNPKDYRDMQTQTRGEFGGLGLEVTMENGVVKVVSPIDDTPAAKAGLLANDLITQIDGEQIAGLTLEQAVEKMRGPVNIADHAHDRAQGRRQSLRREGGARHRPHQPSEGAQRGRRRLHQGDDLQRADAYQPRQGDRGSQEDDRQGSEGLRHRPAQQPGRLAGSGHRRYPTTSSRRAQSS